jgi:hypothetical protein
MFGPQVMQRLSNFCNETPRNRARIEIDWSQFDILTQAFEIKDAFDLLAQHIDFGTMQTADGDIDYTN